ncbi:MAG TPA: hypothetical protein VD837_13915 [Terriglobales bacterium]|nr:hypothetical protein [Terriglobales bacterium]
MKNYLRNLALLMAIGLALALPAGAQQLAVQQEVVQVDVMWVDYDEADISEPAGRDSGYYYDFIDGTIIQQVKQGFDFPRIARKVLGRSKEALNVNAVDAVPDSSWFTNRNGMLPMSLYEIRRGPNQDEGPVGESFTVLRAKTVGITPGLWIRDEQGSTYILKFDPPDYPELATAAEVISTKLFYAIGYNVPQNTIFRFRRSQLQIGDGATYKDNAGREQALTPAVLEELLARVAQEKSGRYRVVASKLLPGKPKGGFKFAGVREDDPNDIIPHEHRRDVRGLRVFSAWLEHNDIRVGNTLDMYVEEHGRRFLRHYLIDFGSTLGSDTLFPNRPEVGHEHQFDMKQAGTTLLTLGLRQPAWTEPEPIRFASVGRYSAEDFDPRRWKSNFPLVAFENMTEADARWAAEIVGSFTDEQIRAAVETGEISEPAAEDYLVKQLIGRRDRIVDAYLDRSVADRTRVASNIVKPALRK